MRSVSYFKFKFKLLECSRLMVTVVVCAQSVGLYSAAGIALGLLGAVFALLFGLLRMSPWPKNGLCGGRVPTQAKAPKRKCCCYCGYASAF
jgi:hypothetical protein